MVLSSAILTVAYIHLPRRSQNVFIMDLLLKEKSSDRWTIKKKRIESIKMTKKVKKALYGCVPHTALFYLLYFDVPRHYIFL